jgi:AcrR family transcriptional regulator
MSLICAQLGVSPSLESHYFTDRSELVSQAWRAIALSLVDGDYERLDDFYSRKDWGGVEAFIFEVLSPDREAARLSCVRAISESLGDEKLRVIAEETQNKTRHIWEVLLEKKAIGVLKPRVSISSLAFLFAAIPLGITAVKFELTAAERADLAASWAVLMESSLRG